MNDDNEKVTLVLDNGSYMTKVGIAGDSSPNLVFRSVVGRSCSSIVKNRLNENSKSEVLIGNDAIKQHNLLDLTYPIQNGLVIDWDDLERLLEHTYKNELKLNPNEHATLITQQAFTPKQNREKLVELIFEKFSMPATYLAIPGVLSLYSSGRTNGIVFESGDSISHIIPNIDGYPIPHAITNFNLAGSNLTTYLKNLLNLKTITFTDLEQVRLIKEKFAYVAYDFKLEMSNSSSNNVYKLPDGKEIKMNNFQFLCSEPLFQPSLLDIKSDGLHEILNNSIRKCDIDLRKDLYANIILSGGNTMFNGMSSRLSKEINYLTSNKIKIDVIASDDRNYSAWIGGSVLASLSTFRQMWIYKREYEEFGSSIAFKKCF